MRATLGGRLAVAVGIVAVVLATAAGAHAATQTRYSLVHGCYAVSQQGRSLPGADRVRMQATALGRYLLYTPDRRFVAARPGGAVGVDTRPEPGVGLAGRRREQRPVHPHGRRRRRHAARRRLHRDLRLRRVPRGRAGRDGHAVQGRHQLRPRRRPGRGPHALDDLSVPRRPLPLRQALGRVRHPLCPARLLLDRGTSGARGADPELPQLRQPGPAARHHRLADARVLDADQPDLRGHLLALDPARVDGRAAADGHEPQREPDPLPAAGQPPDRLRRDGHRTPQPRGDPRAPGLRRRAVRRARQGVLPDRHRPRAGTPRDQPGADGRRAGGRGVRAVRLLGHRPLDVRPGAGRRAGSTSCIASACAPCCC